jgi:hypothetical protein
MSTPGSCSEQFGTGLSRIKQKLVHTNLSHHQYYIIQQLEEGDSERCAVTIERDTKDHYLCIN